MRMALPLLAKAGRNPLLCSSLCPTSMYMLRRCMPKSIPSPRRTAAKAPVRILTWPKMSCKTPKVQIKAMAKGRSMRKRIRNCRKTRKKSRLTPMSEMIKLLCRSLRVRASSSRAMGYPPAKVTTGAAAIPGWESRQLRMAVSAAVEAAAMSCLV